MRSQRSKLLFVAVPAVVAVLAVTVSALVGSARVTAATTAVPNNMARPTVTGTAQEGQRLVGHRGQWGGTPPIAYTYFWQRCDKDGGSCAAISGTYGRNAYAPKGVDVGNRLRFRVRAENAEGAQATSSLPTAVIKAAVQPVNDGCAQRTGLVPIAAISSPARLTIDQALVEPSPITHGTRSFTARIHVSGCGGPVQGALVYLTAIPFGQFTVPSEQPTGSDGFATLQFTAMAGYPLNSKQQLLVMFARARKAGEDPLGGISVRRLISFHVTR